MPVLAHATIGIGIALKDSTGLSISQPEVTHAIQIVEDPLDSLPVWNTGV
jgi:hypothetical protein